MTYDPENALPPEWFDPDDPYRTEVRNIWADDPQTFEEMIMRAHNVGMRAGS